MAFAARLLVAFAVVGLVASPLRADVVPSRYAEKSDDAAKVQARLAQLGVSGAEAQAQADRMTTDEASYFAACPERLQRAGQELFAGQGDPLWYELLFGAAALTGAIVLLAIYLND
jgi:hypothetical protein